MTQPICYPAVRFMAHMFILLAAWTVVIKYLFPMAFAAATGQPIGQFIYWDLWPLAHLWLAWALLHQVQYQRPLAIVMSVLEISIILVFFYRFLSDPEWTIWRTNWFINKLFVLFGFCALLVMAVFKRRWFEQTQEPI